MIEQLADRTEAGESVAGALFMGGATSLIVIHTNFVNVLLVSVLLLQF